MKAEIGRLCRRFNRGEIEREIEEELRSHLELSMQAHLQQDMTMEAAKDAALRRFGNVEQIKDQCVEIARRSNPLLRAFKTLLMLVFFVGVLVRLFSTDLYVMRVGDMLIAVPLLGRLLLYVRGLSPSQFLPRHEISFPLKLNNDAPTSFTVYDQRNLTPVERVISDR